jgi:hypothetical protein
MKKLNKKIIFYILLVNPKFPTDTVAGMYKVAVATNYMFDSVRFDS